MKAAFRVLPTLLLLCPILLGAMTLRIEIVHLPPYTYMENGQAKGVGTEKIEATLHSAGIPFTISEVKHYGVAVQNLRENKSDGFFLATRNESRDKLAFFIGPFLPYRSNWCMLANSKLDPHSKHFIRKARVGALKDSNSLLYLVTQQYHITSAPETPQKMLEALRRGEVDAILTGDLVFLDMIDKAKLPRSDFKMVLRDEQDYGLYLSRKTAGENPGLIEKIQAALAASK